LASFLAALPRGILRHSEWIGYDMKTKIQLLWQHAQIIWIHHFAEYSKVPSKFRTAAVFGPQSTHE
jgi:hypothetical protein